MPAITQASIAAAMAGDTRRDATIPGPHLKVSAHRRSYYLYFRTKDGTERRPKTEEN